MTHPVFRTETNFLFSRTDPILINSSTNCRQNDVSEIICVLVKYPINLLMMQLQQWNLLLKRQFIKWLRMKIVNKTRVQDVL